MTQPNDARVPAQIHAADVAPRDLVEWPDGQVVSTPKFQPYALALLLNSDAFPVLSVEGVSSQVESMLRGYVARVNGYRLLAEQRAGFMRQRLAAAERAHAAEARLLVERAKLMLLKSEEMDGNKPKYSAEYKVKAAVEVALATDPTLAKLCAELSQALRDMRGYEAKIDSMRLHMQAAREEINGYRDMIGHLVNSGLAAAAGVPMSEEMADADHSAAGLVADGD